MSSGSRLPPPEHAAFAVNSRLLSCLVTEKLLRAIYIPIIEGSPISGILIVLSKHLVSEPPILDRTLRGNDIFAIVPLRHAPVIAPVTETVVHKHGRPVELVDPLDMLSDIYEFSDRQVQVFENVRRISLSLTSAYVSMTVEQNTLRDTILSCLDTPFWELEPSVSLTRVIGVIHLWQKFVDGIILQDGLREAIKAEIQSSYDYQRASSLHRDLVIMP